METEKQKVVIITGCDSGMGFELASLLADKGYFVVASYLEKDRFRGRDNIITCKCDLRKEMYIRRFTKLIIKAALKNRTLYALVNNAGIAKGGPIENMPLDTFREVMEVNYFGIVSLTGKLLPYIIESKGRIIIHGSMAGRIALPFMAPYTASKSALEGYADSLRREMNPFGVQVTLLQTAGVATPIWDKAKKTKPENFSPAYQRSLELFGKKFIDEGNKGLAQEKAARQICGIMEKKRMHPRYIIAKSRLVSRLERRIPDRFFDNICVRLFEMNYGDRR